MTRPLKVLLATLAGWASVSVTAYAAPPKQAPGTEFIRFVDNADRSARLEVADAAYRNKNGVVVHLIGAVHIADQSFFDALNESFAHYNALLYEMVKPRGMVLQKPQPGRKSHHWVGGMQQFMKDNLDLAYQMECIDYTAGNFVHADLDFETFEARQDEKGESIPGMMLTAMRRELFRNMAGEFTPTIGVMDLVNALKSPERARDLKVVLGKQMANADHMLDLMEDEDGSVLITERNQAALDVLKKRIKKGDKFLGIFYGAGHLKRMEKTLVEEMGFSRIDVTWRTAWDIPKPVKGPTTLPTTAPTTLP